MPTFHQDESAFRLFNHLPRRGNTFRAAREHLQLRYVGRHQRAERHQFLLQNLYRLFVEQAVARRRNHDWVEDDGGRMIGFDETRDGAYDAAVHRHSDFQRINGDVVENRCRLLVNRLCVNGNRFFDPRGVLYRQRRYGRRAITPQGRKRFQVGLYSRAAVGVGTSNAQAVDISLHEKLSFK